MLKIFFETRYKKRSQVVKRCEEVIGDDSKASETDRV